MKSEADKFDAVVRTLLSVSHEEIQKRDKEWRRIYSATLMSKCFVSIIAKT